VAPKRSNTTRGKSVANRKQTRNQGPRPIEIRLPDVGSPEFAAQAHRQSLAVAWSPQEKDDQAFIDAPADWDDD
jgi:Protein  of unknown function (DUF3018)